MTILLDAKWPGGAEPPAVVPPAAMSGDPEPFAALYDALRRVARGLVRRTAWDGGSLGPTGLVHEAALRILADAGVRGHDERRYVFGAAVRAMRRVLLDRARQRQRLKRGGGWRRVPLDDVLDHLEAQDVDVFELHEAVEALARWSPRPAEAVTLRYFARMTVAEVADHLGVCNSTAEADLAFARAWLRRELLRRHAGPPA